MAVSFKVEDVNISAIRDRAMFNTFAGDASYIIDGIGDELEITYSANSFVVTLGSGEAVIKGGSMVSEGVPSALTLGNSESGYIVIRIDLSQTGANICRFLNVASLVQENINDGSGVVYDLPLYEYTTDESGVQNLVDIRNISGIIPEIVNINNLLNKAVLIDKQNTAAFHNSIYRGKNLGSSVTADQYSAISSGAFTDLFIGDYWTINGVNWRIAAFDYWLNCGDSNCTTHHVVIVPDSNLLNGNGSTTHWMNATNITTGAYVGSDWYTGNNGNTGKSQVATMVNNAFGSGHILTHREYLKNAVTNGYESAGAWYDSTIEFMNEQMVYGNRVFANVINGTNVPAGYTIDKSQLPLFTLEPSRICNRANWWLRDVVSSTHFAYVNANGYAHSNIASATWVGVRPAFAIKA